MDKARRLDRGPAILVITLLAGPLPMAVLAAADGTLLPSATHKFPLVAVPSVLVGDFLFLPLFNYVAVPLILRAGSALMAQSRRASVSVVLAVFAASAGINAATHYSWVHDDYTGYTDSQLGHLSVAGWWHLGFSIAEMAVVGLFVILWVRAARSETRDGLRRGYGTAGILLVAFTSLGIVGAVITRTIILPGMGLGIVDLVVSVGPFVAAASVLLYTTWLARQPSRHTERML